jgi:PAS domain S-box-containing protein
MARDHGADDAALAASLEELYEDAPCGYLFTRPDGAIARVNRTFLAWTGYAREELLAPRRFQDLLTVPGKIFYENQYAPLLLLRGAVREVAFDLVRPGRAPLPVLVNAVLKSTPAGHPALIASTIFDATERRAYERELLLARRRAEELAAVVTTAGDAIVSTSPAGIVRTWNAAAARLFGRDERDSIGRDLREFLDLPEAVAKDGPLLPAPDTGRPVYLEALAVHADGRRIDVSVGLTPHPAALGAPGGVSAIIRDISARRDLERLQQEFLAMAGHELRNPLAAIRGNAQLLRRREAYSARAVDAIVAQTTRLDRLVGDLLLTSQLAADRLDLQLVETDLAAEARAAVAALPPDGPPIRLPPHAGPLPVLVDRHRLGQVLANLLANAIKYSPEGGDIVVRLSRVAAEARVAVGDRGVGIAPEDLPHLFDRFFRVAATAGVAPGLGLGLYIARRIVEAHGGRLTAESTAGAGSTFTVALPLAAGGDAPRRPAV